jgi:hypothetical protein
MEKAQPAKYSVRTMGMQFFCIHALHLQLDAWISTEIYSSYLS